MQADLCTTAECTQRHLLVVSEDAIHAPFFQLIYFLRRIRRPYMHTALQAMNPPYLLTIHAGNMRMQSLIIIQHESKRTRPDPGEARHGKQTARNLGTQLERSL